jgi:PAS domain S-box-containing protein
MKPVRSVRLEPASVQAGIGLLASPAFVKPAPNRDLLTAAVFASVAMVAALDLLTSAELIASILFTFPLALCALQPSKRLLWTTAVLAALLTATAGFWGPYRGGTPASPDEIASRAFLVASLFTLAAFIHLWLRKNRLGSLDATEIIRQRDKLAAQNEQLELLVATATRNIGVREAADEHLVQMEARYRGLLEAAPDAMVVVNQAGAIVLLNVQAEKTFGYRRDELVGQQVKNIIPDGFAERLVADGTRTAAEALAQQIGSGIELIGRRKDGGEFPMELMLSPLESADGILVTAAIRDIGVRKAAEANLVQMEARYRGLLEAAPDAMVVVNQTGEIVILNLQAEKQFGYRRDELLGLPVKTVIPHGFAERLIADGTRTAAEALAQQIGTGLELIGRRKDSSEFPIELMLSPLENSDGILVTAAIRNVTARQADQDALRASEEWHRMAVEVTEMGTWVWNLISHEITWSAQFRKMFGFSLDGVLTYEAMMKTVHPEDRKYLEVSIWRSFETGDPYDVEHRIVWPDGSQHWIASRGRVQCNAEGVPEGMQGTILDVTERKAGQDSIRERPGLDRTAAELMRSNADLQQFAYVAAHDLQEPLRMVSSYTQLLGNRYKGRLDAQADEFIVLAVDGAQRMQLLISDLLAYCQVGTSGQKLRETSAADALRLAVENLQGAIKESGGVVTCDALPTLLADPAQLTQLFQNLVGNALKYRGADPPCVHVSAKRNRARDWVFAVRDNGLGIEPRHFARIFLMFQRLHARDAFSGTGIGLSLCRKIVERHGGRIWIKSKPNEGSTFYVAFPEGGVARAPHVVGRAAAQRVPGPRVGKPELTN